VQVRERIDVFVRCCRRRKDKGDVVGGTSSTVRHTKLQKKGDVA